MGSAGDAEVQCAGAAWLRSFFTKKHGLKLPGSLIFKKQPEIQFFFMGNQMTFYMLVTKFLKL